MSIRLEKATEILKKADSTLETFSSILDRAEKKLKKSYLTFNDAKRFLNKKYVESVGSNVFWGLQANLFYDGVLTLNVVLILNADG